MFAGLENMYQMWSPLRAAPAFYLGALVYHERDSLKFQLPSWAPAAACLARAAGSFAQVPLAILLWVAYIASVATLLTDLHTSPTDWVRRLAPLGQYTYSIFGLFERPARTWIDGLKVHSASGERLPGSPKTHRRP